MCSMGASCVINAGPDGYLAQVIMVLGYDTRRPGRTCVGGAAPGPAPNDRLRHRGAVAVGRRCWRVGWRAHSAGGGESQDRGGAGQGGGTGGGDAQTLAGRRSGGGAGAGPGLSGPRWAAPAVTQLEGPARRPAPPVVLSRARS